MSDAVESRGRLSAPAPLRAIVETVPGAPSECEIEGIGVVWLRTVVHKLECGHTTEPYIRGGCRQSPLPKRRRCKQCRETK